jgi:hypothetical protein
MLHILIRDVRRATLPGRSGNEGWIGLSPAGDRYHVVAPVDAQIAKGVMACNWPTDGTPFGGYTGWLYFRCEPYDDEGDGVSARQEDRVRANCQGLLKFAALYGLLCVLKADTVTDSPEARSCREELDAIGALPSTGGRGAAGQGRAGRTPPDHVASCGACGKGWTRLRDLLRDPAVKLVRYRVCPDDFRSGTYVFSHVCSGAVEVPVTHFSRPRSTERSLIDSHACPGLCHHETCLRACSARCEGARYRRIAAKLKSRPTS